MNSERLSESLRRFAMRKATVDSTAISVGVDEDTYVFVIYARDGDEFVVRLAKKGKGAP